MSVLQWRDQLPFAEFYLLLNVQKPSYEGKIMARIDSLHILLKIKILF